MQFENSKTLLLMVLVGMSLPQMKAGVKHFVVNPNIIVKKDIISGTITDQTGKPVTGATVLNLRTQQTATSDSSGSFTIDGNVGDSLEISHLSYGSITVAVTRLTNFSVAFNKGQDKAKESLIDEVVVVGYGRQKKVNLTGSVDQITAEALENRPVSNIAQALVGASPNLNLKMLDGKPTQSPAFNIRGTTSVGQGGSALVLIDGVEGDPRMLNPSDVESISVLKDAASASIYGARAAFGVVLITTKNAKKGRTSVNYSTSISYLQPTTTPELITESYPWSKGFNDAWSRWNDNGNTPTAINKTLPFSQAYLEEIKRRWENPSLPRIEINPATGEYQYFYSTNWYKELMKDHWYGQNHDLVLSGGGEKAQFYLSGRYNGQDGMFRYNSDDYNMYNIRGKGNINVTDWFSIENNSEYSTMNYHQPLNVGEGSGIWRNMADEGHPLAPLLNPDGTLSFSAAYTVGDYYYGKNYRDAQQKFLKNRTAATAKFFDNALTFKGDFTFQNNSFEFHQRRVPVPYSRFKGVIGYTGANTNDLEERRSHTDYIATNVYANYITSLMEVHNFNILAGFNYEKSTYKNLTASRNGLIFSDADDINLAFGQSISTIGGYQRWAVAGGFFRLNYDWDGRYLFEFNGRYDGSSKFPTDQQYAFFPSASIGWRIAKEPFWKVSSKAISDIKLRASYGSLGNGNISPYAFTENFGIRQSDRILNGIRPQITSQPGVVPIGLTWETVTTANAGLDLEALSRRLTFNFDIYRRWTKDMFTVGPTLPAVFGTTVPKGNYADMQTTGWELTLAWNDRFNLAHSPFKYDFKFILSDYTSTITKYNNADKVLTDYYEGMKVGEIWGYRTDGLFKSPEDVKNSPYQGNIPNTNTRKNYPGDLKFKDLDGDNVIYQGLNRVGNSGDKTIIGNSEPRYIFGVNLGAEWSGFFVSTFFQGVMRQHWYPAPESRFWGQYNRPYNSFPAWHEANMFREELQNYDAYLPRLVGYTAQGGRALGVANDRYLQNAAYIRLRNLQVGYSLPQKWISKIRAQKISLYFSGENLWTWSPMYKRTKDTDVTSIYGSDRDLSGGTSGDGYNYPMLRNMALGLNINF
ncbi:TonB-dependent receptor [Chryseobacterium taklimakanense]|uniref:SusC/RagA family TonB-linked outer membrane protein n=1 Tax=Chryseobacterium taklimakanense TaxID=536441 RepID=UPI000F5DE04E|nr:TonB-dependent receptor [Chryseobacterium taklimakanense]AZI21599.1 TonB-dependent receptor [Chryseobacterium taklimakanense]